MTKTLKSRTEELLLDCLTSYEWVDEALFNCSDKLLDMINKVPRSAKEIESMARLLSKYASYLDPTFCSKNFATATQQAKFDELTSIKQSLECAVADDFSEIPFASRARIKTLESFDEKIWRKGSTPSKAESDLKDMIAFRMIIGGRTAKEYVPECYYFFDTLVECLIEEHGFKPVPGSTKGTEGFDPANFDPEFLYIPEEIPKDCKYIHLGKDYIRTPKANGYQGLQLSLYSPQRELYVEIQTKTQIMFENSEFFESSHDDVYKGGETGVVDSRLFDGFDLRRLNNLHGFHSRDGKRFVDHLGLIVPRSF